MVFSEPLICYQFHDVILNFIVLQFFYREAWRKLGGMSKDEAKMKYINVLKEIDPGWIETNNKDQISTKVMKI